MVIVIIVVVVTVIVIVIALHGPALRAHSLFPPPSMPLAFPNPPPQPPRQSRDGSRNRLGVGVGVLFFKCLRFEVQQEAKKLCATRRSQGCRGVHASGLEPRTVASHFCPRRLCGWPARSVQPALKIIGLNAVPVIIIIVVVVIIISSSSL